MPFSRQAFTGFPFDRDFDRNRDGSFRSKLDDIAKRHPEFAEHVHRYPRRSSTSRTEDPAEEYVRRFERPFGSRFERFGFPFDDEFERGEQQSTKQEQNQNPQSSSHHQSGPQYNPHSPQYQEPKPKQTSTTDRSDNEQSQSCSSSESQPQEPTRGRTRNIQQSNTVDLGQKQEEALNERNQRSMSAPPSDNRQGQRFVSSINIPINRETGSEDNRNMGKQYSTQPQGGSHSQGITERVIPIHVEGRDDPVLPKNAQQNFGHQPQQPSPQPERIFGQRPEQFTQFVREPRASQFPSDWTHPTGFDRHAFPEEEEFIRKQHSPSHQQFQQRASSPQRQPPHRPSTPQHHQHPKSQEQQAQAQQAPPKSETLPPQPQVAKEQPLPKQTLTPVEQIQSIQRDVSELLKQVEDFRGAPKDKQYLYLDEMLTRNLLKLDNVDTQGQDTIRSARKEAIKCIEKGIGALEARAAANVAPKRQENMEIEQEHQKQNEGDKEETMDTAESGEQQPMEVATEHVKGEDMKSENVAAPKELIEHAKLDENVPLEEHVVNVKDAVSNIEQSHQNEGNNTEHEKHSEETKEKVESSEQKEESNENSKTKKETKVEEKMETKKIKKKAADKEEKQK